MEEQLKVFNEELGKIKRDTKVQALEFCEMLVDRGCPNVAIGFISIGGSFTTHRDESPGKLKGRIRDALQDMFDLLNNDLEKLGDNDGKS